MLDDLLKKCLKYSKHINGISGVRCMVMDTVKKEFIYYDTEKDIKSDICSNCIYKHKDQINTHLYGSSESYRWDGKYIYYCPIGLVFVASSITDDIGNMTASLIAGPIVMGDLEDVILNIHDNDIKSHICSLPKISTSMINDLAEIMAVVTSYLCETPHGKVGSYIYEQQQLMNTIYDIKDLYNKGNKEFIYPLEYEKKLQKLFLEGDKKGSQLLLNELLGHIFLSSNFDLDNIKARVIELLVLLSRATIDIGADMNEILFISTSNIKEMEKFTDIEKLSVWITGIMHRFINYSFDFKEVKHYDVTYKAIEFIKLNYSRKITLEEIANHVYLSKAYLSSVFKNETEYTLTSYINIVRVEKSKQMLLSGNRTIMDISSACGFEDQSYYTKVFKKYVGVSPKQYKDSRGKVR